MGKVRMMRGSEVAGVGKGRHVRSKWLLVGEKSKGCM